MESEQHQKDTDNGELPVKFREVFLDKILANCSSWGWPANAKGEDLKVSSTCGHSSVSFIVQLKPKNETQEPQETPSKPPIRILVKEFLDGFVDEIKEATEQEVAQTLSNLSKGPRILQEDPKIRIQELIEGRTIGSKSDLTSKPVIRAVAYCMQSFHRLKPPTAQKKAFSLRCFDGDFPLLNLYKKNLQVYKDKGVLTQNQIEIGESVGRTMTTDAEIEWIRTKMPQFDLVFSHNDFYHNNLVLKESNGLVYAIDYESAAYNPRGVDIAGFMSEMKVYFGDVPGYEFDYKSRELGELAKELLYSYLYFESFETELTEEEALEVINGTEKGIAELAAERIGGGGHGKPLEEVFGDLVEEVIFGQLLNHIYMALWAVAASNDNEIENDYFGYAEKQVKGYIQIKKDVYSQENLGPGGE